MDSSGQFITMIGEGEGKLSFPTALHIADKYVYISDWGNHNIAVYETSGQYVTSFGKHGGGEGEFSTHTVSPLVSVGVYMCATRKTVECKCSKSTRLHCDASYYYYD